MNFDLIEYDIVPLYTRENIAEFLFSDQEEEFLSTKKCKEYVDQYLQRLAPAILFAMKRDGWKIVITNHQNLEQEFGFSYKIYGLTHWETKRILLYASQKAIEFALAHEIGHYLDHFLGDISKTGAWTRIRQKHFPCKIPNDYFVEDLSSNLEYFAECFLLYSNEKEVLKTCNIDAYQFFAKIDRHIDDIVESLPPLNDCEKTQDPMFQGLQAELNCMLSV